MKKNLKKSISYGVVAFILSAYYLGVITSPDWGRVNYGDGTILIHIKATLGAMLTGMMVLAAIAVGFKRIPSVMNTIHLGAGMFAQAVAFGVAFFMCWVGIGMFQLMAAPENIITAAYRGGAMFSAMVAVVALPLIYWFWKRHGRLLSFDDFSDFSPF